MVDIHTHILPEVDDGSEIIADSLRMAKMAVECGVHTLFATPHCNRREFYKNYYNDNLQKRFLNLQKAVEAEGLPLRILPGMEIYATEEVPQLIMEGHLITLNNSRYLLIEFGIREDLALIDFLIEELTDMGYQPIIAHPERYLYVQRYPDIVYGWLASGCYLQLNKDSILGRFGRRVKNCAFQLLERNLVSFVASDAHSPEHRTTDFSEVAKLLIHRFGSVSAEVLLHENPARIIDNLDLLPVYPLLSYDKRIVDL